MFLKTKPRSKIKMPNKQKISVVLATYNGESFVVEQLRSIVNQTVKPDEIIVVDDCSKDKTLDVVSSFAKQCEISIVIEKNEHNSGVSKTFENGVKRASGDIVLFSDQDDCWRENKVEKILFAMSNYDTDFVFSNAAIVDEKLTDTNVTLWDSIDFAPKNNNEYVCYEKSEFFPELLKHNVVTGMTVACRKDFLTKCLPFPSFLLHDYWLALNASTSVNMIAINDPLVLYRQHSNNVVGVNKKHRKRDKAALKKRHLIIVQSQIMLFKSVIEICEKNNSSEEIKKMAQDYYNFSVNRENALNTSIFSVLKLRKDYKKYTYRDYRFFEKDIFYRFFLKGEYK